MSIQPLRLPPPLDPWVLRVRNAVDTTWRPSEYDHTSMTFAGNPDEPSTILYRCDCGTVIPAAGQPCWSCATQVQRRNRSGGWGGERISEFTLADLPVLVGYEVLFCLQQSTTIDLKTIRPIVAALRKTEVESLLDLTPELLRVGRLMLRDWQAALTRLKLTDAEIIALDEWDPRWLRLAGKDGNHQAIGRVLSFSAIDVPWVKEVTKRWIFDLAGNISPARNSLRLSVILCEVMHQRGLPDPLSLTYSDFEAVWFTILALPVSDSEKNRLCSVLDRVTRHGQRLGLTAPAFLKGETTVMPGGGRKGGGKDEDQLGRGITEPEAEQLAAALPSLPSLIHGRRNVWSVEDQVLMFTTMFVISRETGRRPGEVAALRKGCVRRVKGEPTLIYDNTKARRFGRRLPVSTVVEDAVARWEVLRTERGGIRENDRLFPPMHYRARGEHIDQQWFARKLAALAETVGLPGVIPYDFRHAYAQRHADAGVPVEILAELMDHSDIEQTRGYYTVALERKQEAIAKVAPLTVGRAGAAASIAAYEIGAVAVPFGNCSEPSNVKSGGHSCPIRYQCSGCSFFRTDPSYLPAIEDHIANLRVQVEIYRANGSAPFIIEGMAAELSAYGEVVSSMKEKMDSLDDAQRRDLADASEVLRRARSARKLPIVAIT